MPLDLGDVDGSANRFEHAYGQALQAMKRTLDGAASEARASHPYRDRTGNLSESTQASEVYSTGDTDAVTLSAEMPYASYVAARGLMTIDDAAQGAAKEIDYILDGVALSARVT